MKAPPRDISSWLTDSSKEHVCCAASAKEDEARQAAKLLGYSHWTVRLPETFNHTTIVESFGKTLSFPEPYGRGWDAMIDCLRYLPDSKGYLILIKAIDRLWIDNPSLYYKLTHILRDLGQEFHSWKDEEVPFKVLLLTENAELIRVVGCEI